MATERTVKLIFSRPQQSFSRQRPVSWYQAPGHTDTLPYTLHQVNQPIDGVGRIL
ncbi:hypothetical protein QM565_38360 [Geitlerinema splendidum]|nr:hypothetical protein [Geitlerinema splendidum]